jgi:galactokinase
MDQAASIFGVPSHALHISFFPKLAIRALRLPDSTPKHTLLIANTLVVSDKKVSGPVQYNLRVVELWMAARVLAKQLGLPRDASTKTLRKLMHVYFEKHPLEEDEAAQELGEEAAQIKKLGQLAEQLLPSHDVTRAEVEQLTGFEGEAFEQEFLSAFPSEL